MLRLNTLLRTIRRDERGASAVEFSLIAPMLVLSFLAMVDLGRAFYEQIGMDQALRAGSEGAMLDIGESDVAELIRTVAAENFDVSSGDTAQDGSSTTDGAISTEGPAQLSVGVDRFCSCPGSVDTEVSCSIRCDATTFPYTYYEMNAAKEFDGFLIPTLNLSSDMRVQIR